MTAGEPARISDPAVMRALAHPVRLDLLEHLSSTEAATATECAGVVGLSPSATSYHLRALARVGLIEDAPSRGDGRERVWQARHRHGYSFRTERDATPDQTAAEDAMMEAVLARQNDKVRRAIAVLRGDRTGWKDAATLTDATLTVTVDELSDLLRAIEGRLDPLRRRNRVKPPAQARTVSFQLRAVPTD